MIDDTYFEIKIGYLAAHKEKVDDISTGFMKQAGAVMDVRFPLLPLLPLLPLRSLLPLLPLLPNPLRSLVPLLPLLPFLLFLPFFSLPVSKTLIRLQVARQVQNHIGRVADRLEQITNLLTWEDPAMSRQIAQALLVGLLMTLFFPFSILRIALKVRFQLLRLHLSLRHRSSVNCFPECSGISAGESLSSKGSTSTSQI